VASGSASTVAAHWYAVVVGCTEDGGVGDAEFRGDGGKTSALVEVLFAKPCFVDVDSTAVAGCGDASLLGVFADEFAVDAGFGFELEQALAAVQAFPSQEGWGEQLASAFSQLVRGLGAS